MRFFQTGIKPDETVVLFPAVGWREPADGSWQVRVHAWIHEQHERAFRRMVALAILGRTLPELLEHQDLPVFRERLRPFLVPNRRGRQLRIRIAGRELTLPRSGSNGHVEAVISLSPAEVEQHAVRCGNGFRRMTCEVLLAAEDTRTLEGPVTLVEPEGLSVISDIDDTLKVTTVRDRAECLLNTFVRPFQAVPGMAELLARLRNMGAACHFVSSSPWQLSAPLRDLFDAQEISAESIHLRTLRLGELRSREAFAGSPTQKHAAICRLLGHFPLRRFLLLGDTGERDPELYGEIQRMYPDRVRGILLRNLTAETRDTARMSQAMAGVPDHCWQLFTDPAQYQTEQLLQLFNPEG